MEFDGVDDYVNIANDDSLRINETWTYSAWIKRDSISTDEPIFSQWENSAGNKQLYFFIRHASSDKLRIDIPYKATILLGNTPVADTNWHHVSFTKSGTTWSIYLDGQNDGSTIDATVQDASSTIDLRIGAHSDGSIYFNGSIDEVRIYNRALSADEITRLYNMGR